MRVTFTFLVGILTSNNNFVSKIARDPQLTTYSTHTTQTTADKQTTAL